ncbi:translocation/assembly module TamB domain-containing protein [Armatimonas sp.]|uniref:translocation/assembly module TamB domain-containing protein n=1 Tax=Armatimonas sp. TaxID=1872638 RepID=UPI00286BB1AC|nr:translocation/assembly module TamB domain-containing protein [Armatimonas sp.]
MRRVGAAANGLLAVAVAVAPPLAFGRWSWSQVQRRVDEQLATSKPLIEQEASAALERPVRIGKLTPELSIATLQAALQREVITVAAEDVELGCRPEERRWAGQDWLLRVPRVSARLSPAALQAGTFSENGLREVTVERPEVVVFRTPEGKLSVESFLPKPKTPPDLTQPAFQTFVKLRGAQLRFRDFASLRAPGKLEENRLEGLDATADLMGSRTVRFIAKCFPAGLTKSRLAGPLELDGTVRRGEPGPRDDSPQADQPLLSLHATARNADLPYWLTYAVKPRPEATLTRGRATAQIALVLRDAKDIHPLIRAEAQFSGVDVLLQQPTKTAITDLTGQATYDGNALATALQGKALGESFTVNGTLSALESQSPQIAATVTMPRVPIASGMKLFPQLKLPKELRLGPFSTLEGATLTGTLQNPSAVARVSGITASWQGLPTVTASASLSYSQDTVAASAITARLAGGGTLTGLGSYALKSRSGTFEAHLRGAELARVGLLKELKTPPSGQLSADLRGTILKETLSASGLAQATKLNLAGLSFPNASAQLSLSGKRLQILDGMLSGESGTVRVAGSGELGGALALDAHLVGADLGKLTAAFGLPGVGGTLSASVQLTGTEKAPLLQLRDITVLQPRYRFDNHVLVADAAHAERASLRLLSTGQVRIELDPMEPLRVAHSPAVALLYGTITGTKDSAQLNLTATAENVEVDEILAQFSDEPGRYAPPTLQKQPGYRKLLDELEWSGVPKPPVSGFVRTAKATITGDAKDPQISGEATLGRLLVTDFPIEGGTLAFSQEAGNLRVHSIQLATATGTLTGEAQLDADKKLSGMLVANSVDLEALSSLSGLVEKQLGITGAVSATLRLAGTQERPLLTAHLTEVRPIEVAGLPLTELNIGDIQLNPEIVEDAPLRGTITLPQAALKLGAGAATLALSEVRYDLESQQLSASIAVTEAKFQKIVEVLRHAHLEDTQEGRDFLSSLYNIPTTINTTANLTGTLSARITPDGPRDRRASLRLTTSDLRVQPEGSKTAVTGQLTARATLTDERLSLDSATLSLADAKGEEPMILRLLPRPDRDPKTGEMVTAKSWLRLPYSKDEPLEYHLTLDTNAIPLDLVKALMPKAIPVPIQGKASATLSADGTPTTPRITASFFGDNLLLGETTGSTDTFNAPPLTLDQFRFQVELVGLNKTEWSIALSDGRIAHNKEVLTFSGTLPYDPINSRIAANRPINLQTAIDDGTGITLETLAQYFKTNSTKLAGTIRGGIQVTGSLNEPRLGGKLILSDSSIRFPNPNKPTNREVINPIQHLDIVAEFAGKEIRFPRAELALTSIPPAPKQERGKPVVLEELTKVASAGKLTLEPGSVIRLENLEDFTRLFVRKDEIEGTPKLRGEFDLKARFTDFQLDADNATALLMSQSITQKIGGGLEEALKGKVNGQLTIKGPLLTPTIATTATGKLRLEDLVFRTPKRQLPETAENQALAFNPRFVIALETTTDARLVNPDRLSGFEFKGNGGVTISGDLAAPKIEGLLVPTGGYYQYPLSRFTVQRGGEIRLTYAKRFEAGQDALQLDIRMQDVVAEGKVLVSASSVKSSQSSPTLFDPNRASNQIPDSLVGKRITVTARFNGLIRMGDSTRDSSRTQTNPIRLSSDTELSEFALLSLLVPYQMLTQFVGNNSQQALKDSFNMLQSGLTGTIFTPFTDQVSKFFGLDNFSVDYSIGGLANFYLIRRLPEPFDKVTLEVRRSLQTRTGGVLLPQFYSLNYEIGQLRRGSRLQLGASTNEQRDNQLFLRGTLRY